MISKIEVERFTLSSAKPFVRFHRTKSRSENTKTIRTVDPSYGTFRDLKAGSIEFPVAPQE
jgi:hypothetical protein